LNEVSLFLPSFQFTNFRSAF